MELTAGLRAGRVPKIECLRARTARRLEGRPRHETYPADLGHGKVTGDRTEPDYRCGARDCSVAPGWLAGAASWNGSRLPSRNVRTRVHPARCWRAFSGSG